MFIVCFYLKKKEKKKVLYNRIYYYFVVFDEELVLISIGYGVFEIRIYINKNNYYLI